LSFSALNYIIVNMKTLSPVAVFVSFLLIACLVSGCTSYPTTFLDIFGVSREDLEKARKDGIKKEFSLSYDETFDRVTKILQSNNLTIYQSSRKKGYIVAMNFPKQTNTTRVGIFFEPVNKGKTSITLSSLSSTALAKAEATIMGGLEAELKK